MLETLSLSLSLSLSVSLSLSLSLSLFSLYTDAQFKQTYKHTLQLFSHQVIPSFRLCHHKLLIHRRTSKASIVHLSYEHR